MTLLHPTPHTPPPPLFFCQCEELNSTLLKKAKEDSNLLEVRNLEIIVGGGGGVGVGVGVCVCVCVC